MNKLIIFDCDGTLVDSAATIVSAVAETFAAHGLAAPPPRDCRRVIGLSLIEAMAQLAPDAGADDHLVYAETYKTCFFRARSEGRVEEPLFEGVAALIDALDADGWLLAVATGKSDRGLGHCLDCHGLRGRFVSLQTADRHPSKPHPSMALQAMAEAGAAPERTFVIGDTAFDMGMALRAGATGIGAAWGYHEPEELLAAGAAAVASEAGGVMRLLPVLEEKLYG